MKKKTTNHCWFWIHTKFISMIVSISSKLFYLAKKNTSNWFHLNVIAKDNIFYSESIFFFEMPLEVKTQFIWEFIHSSAKKNFNQILKFLLHLYIWLVFSIFKCIIGVWFTCAFNNINMEDVFIGVEAAVFSVERRWTSFCPSWIAVKVF